MTKKISVADFPSTGLPGDDSTSLEDAVITDSWDDVQECIFGCSGSGGPVRQ